MNLHDPGQLRSFLEKHGLWANKGLAQHFLCSSKVLNAISNRIEGIRGILEIGPGIGALTGMLTENDRQVVAYEVDERFPEVLAESAPRAHVILEDAVSADLEQALSTLPSPKAIVSNMPYHITGLLLNKVADCADHIDLAVLMMQKEVGDRILSPVRNSNRGSLSVFLQALFEVTKVCDAPPGAFLPPPKVQSIVLQFKPTRERFDPHFFMFVRSGFQQPRKTLVNNLISGGKHDRQSIEDALHQLGLDVRIRPQMLSQSQWLSLHSLLCPAK